MVWCGMSPRSTKSLKILAETVESGLLIEVRMRCSGKFLEWFKTLFECLAAS